VQQTPYAFRELREKECGKCSEGRGQFAGVLDGKRLPVWIDQLVRRRDLPPTKILLGWINKGGKMLDLNMLNAMPPGTMFAAGVGFDVSYNIYVAGTGKRLRWVAVRGQGILDWAIYYMPEDTVFGVKIFPSDDRIAREGDKIFGNNLIQRLVPCDDDALKMYRH
jgi:hypothetical protein